MPQVAGDHLQHHFEDVELSPRDESNEESPFHQNTSHEHLAVVNAKSTIEESSHGDRTRVNVISKYQSVSQHSQNAEQPNASIAMGEVETPDVPEAVKIEEIPLMVSQVQLRKSRERNNEQLKSLSSQG